MKKLLLSLVAVLATSTSFAYEVGEYIYTPDARFKIIDTNGIGALNTWNGADDVDVWSVYAGEDATDNCLESLDGGEGATLLFTNKELAYGSKYVFTIRIKGVAVNVSTNTAGGMNEINAFITTEPSVDGVVAGTANTDYFMVANSQTILNEEWTEISFSFADTLTEATIGEGPHYLNITLGRLTTGTVIADAQLCEVQEVYDTRIAERKLRFAQKLLDDTNFNSLDSDAKTELEEMVEMIQEMIEYDEADNIAEMEGALATLQDAQTAYIESVTSNISEHFSNINITSIKKINNGEGGGSVNVGCWSTTGAASRWGHPSGDEWINYTYPGSYALGWGMITLKPNVKLPAGKYLFMCDLYATRYLKNKVGDGYYGEDLSVKAEGTKLFLGKDSLELDPLANRMSEAETYYIVGNVEEGEEFTCGSWFAGFDPNGGTFRIGHASVYSFGDIAEILERQKIWDDFLTQWNAVVNARNSVLAKIGDTENYPWEQDSLQNAQATWDPYYQTVINAGWINENLTDPGKNAVSNEELVEWTKYQGVELYNEEGTRLEEYQLVRNYQWANNYVVAQNQPVADLKAKIAEAKAIKANPDFASGDFSDFDSNLEAAEEMIANISNVNQGDEFNATTQALDDVIKEFLDNFASYKYPLALNVINGNFQDVSGRPKSSDGYRTNGGQVDKWNGWTYYSNIKDEYFRISDAGTNADGEYIYEGHNRAGMWRGYSGNPCGSVTQEITVSKPGMYVFRCQAYCIGDGDSKKILAGVRKIIPETDTLYIEDEEGEWVEEVVEISRDTVYMSGVKLIFGSTAAEKLDSLEIWTQGEGDSGNYTPQWFTMEYDKKTAGEEIIKFGLDGFSIKDYANAGIYQYGPNAYGIGSVTVSYGGATDKYLEDKKKAEEEATKVTLADITDLIDKYLDGVAGITVETITSLIDKYLAQ
jgi:hypothetical protein